MTMIYDMHGRTVRRSKNLASIIRHAKDHELHTVRITASTIPGGCRDVQFWFTGGDNAETEWADWRVLLTWLVSRRNACPAYLKMPQILFDRASSEGKLDALRKRGVTVLIKD